MNNKEQLTALIKKFKLHADDVYIHESKEYKIIKRRGYKRIQQELDIYILFECPHAGSDYAVVIAKGEMASYDKSVYIRRSTLGEANPNNNTFPYPVNVAQKRAEGRLILEMANLYEEGWLTEDEIDETVKGAKFRKKAAAAGTASVENTKSQLGIT